MTRTTAIVLRNYSRLMDAAGADVDSKPANAPISTTGSATVLSAD
jgi:hypothetical protein